MLKRFKIDNRMQEVFVLRQSDTRIVYVPVKSMHRVDYERFKEMSEQKPPRVDLLDYMSKTKLKNGVNALVQYDNIIHVANINKEVGTRIKKTEEIIGSFEHNVQESTAQVTPAPTTDEVRSLTAVNVDSINSSKPLYRFRNKHGKLQEWSGQGRKPDAIQEHLDAGGSLDDFLVK